jgi:hypothetical protein
MPVERDDHALVMAKFARETMAAFHSVTHELERQLGPDTRELGLRVGVHSGPITAGYLRGEKSRVQVFGDSVNTCARIETTGSKNKIHCSEQFAKQMYKAGKDHWIAARVDQVKAKGKGKLNTFWLSSALDGNSSIRKVDYSTYNASYGGGGNLTAESYHGGYAFSSDDSHEVTSLDSEDLAQSRKNEQMYGLIDSMVETLERFLKKIVAARGNDGSDLISKDIGIHCSGETSLDEVVPKISFRRDFETLKTNPSYVTLSQDISTQLRDYVSVIAFMYPQDSAYHNFEHAKFVADSISTLLSRITPPEKFGYVGLSEEEKIAAQNMEEYHKKIMSDPLTQFAAVFAAMILDVEHPLVPNQQLEKEESDLAVLYNKRCIHEQNALDLSWEIFQDTCYSDLRACIFRTKEEMMRFRRILVNCVMSTDLHDERLSFEREARWKNAFEGSEDANLGSSFNFLSLSNLDSNDDRDLKATVMLEYITQAADIFHAYQPWSTYVIWNERQFHEAFEAYVTARVDEDPTDGWYEKELEFFDEVVIPLATKLGECGLFGYNGGDFVRTAKVNRKEWEMRGESLVGDYLARFEGGKCKPIAG